jgi:hypothetical protein
VIPAKWKPVKACNFDTNNDGRPEWIILYHFDLQADTVQHGDPIAAAVYQSDGKEPPNILAYPLYTPDKDYLCECACTPTMEDALSGLGGLELVVRDQCGGESAALTIFNWDLGKPGYLPRGHFHGHRIRGVLDEVTVAERLPDRAQLAECKTFHPLGSMTYYEFDGQTTLIGPAETGIGFCHDEPKDVMASPYPEKVVLSLYTHYTDTEKIRAYFAEGAWDWLGQCDTGQCGCTSLRIAVAHVRVTSLQYVEDPTDPNHTTVEAAVACEYSDGTPESQAFIRWRLVRAADRWQISGTE